MKIQVSLSAAGKKFEDRCTFVVVNALLSYFGKPHITLGQCPITGCDILDILRENGIKRFDNKWYLIRTLHEALTQLPKEGAFYLSGNGHAMALIDGKLIDTSPTTTPKRRKVGVLEIQR